MKNLFVLLAIFLASSGMVNAAESEGSHPDGAVVVEHDAQDHQDDGSFWTSQTKGMALATVIAFVLMIALPITFHVVDEQIGYFFLIIGGVMVGVAMWLGMLDFKDGSFIQHLMHGHTEGFHVIVFEPWMLLLVYFVLSLLAIIFRRQIEGGVRAWAGAMNPALMIAIVTGTVGAAGSISVVVMATVGGVFFRTLQGVTRKNYTPSVIQFSAAIGISALLTTVGEPLSLFIARNLGQGTPYLVQTYTGIVLINVVALATSAWWLALRAQPLPETIEERMMREVQEAEAEVEGHGDRPDEKEVREALEAVEAFEEEEHNFAHQLDALLHSTSKLLYFVVGLLLFGEAVKPLAAFLATQMSPNVAFFVNAISGVADNALLGLLEVQHGMDQAAVWKLGISLAFWGVALVPGNVCNIVLKEKLEISFGDWAKYGIPTALGLCALNFGLLVLGAANWLTF